MNSILVRLWSTRRDLLQGFRITSLARPLLTFLLLFRGLFLATSVTTVTFYGRILTRHLSNFPNSGLTTSYHLGQGFRRVTQSFVLWLLTRFPAALMYTILVCGG